MKEAGRDEGRKRFDLEERTAKFGENIITLCKGIGENAVTRPIISQLVRSTTSIGANYAESQSASSKKDFKNKIHICKKEAQETVYWLRMLSTILPKKKDLIDLFKKEACEFILIFGKIISVLRKETA